MNTLFIIGIVVASSVGLSIIIWFLSSGLRDYQLDLHRQNIFKIRNNLFDLAAAEKISFDDDAYGIVRTTLNGSINFLNDLSFFRFLVFLFFSKGIDTSKLMNQYISGREKAFAKLDSSKRQIYEDAIKEMHYNMISYMIRSSILLSIALRVAALFISLNSLLQAAFSNAKIKRRFEVLDTEASALATA